VGLKRIININPSVSTLPYNFCNGSAVVYNNEIYILGGSSSTRHYKWDGTSWTSVSTLPYDFYRGSAVVYNNEIHILGTSNGNHYTKHYKLNNFYTKYIFHLDLLFIFMIIE
jgi:N-acetylneuraminic acid mutarotase